MKCHDLSYWIYQKVLIETSWPFILNIPKGAYWKVITLQIGYIFKVPIEQKWPYWMKICLLNENVHFDKKCVFCLKMRILNENVSIDRKDTYWMKIMTINQMKNYSKFPTVLIVIFFKLVFFFFFGLNNEKIQESSHTNGSNNNTKWFFKTPYGCFSSQISHSLPYALAILFFSTINFGFNVYILCETMSRY